ncbi:MAG TPA: ATP-binding protein [Chitinophagaceae bacterium]|nr:ATP-binding protein [Chitinophagaceae bacterium]
MKPDKKQEAEVLKVYDAWWHSYLTGDVKTYDSLLDDEYRFVGSTNGEEFLNRKDTTKFFELTADQLAGKAELRNLTRTIEKLDSGHILITDLADAYVISESEWVFYSRFRFTSLMKETKNGWRFIYQHFSAPDTKAQEGETLGTEQITKENQELRDAIKRRTVELENKTRALEIEASLERVRTVAMGMNKPDDMLDICRIISQQLKLLNVKEIRNVQTAIIYEAKGSYLNFEYYAKHEKTFITDVDFKLHPTQFEFVNRMLKGPEEFFNKHFNGKEVQDWYTYQQTTNQFADSYLATATSLNYYWYSMGPVALGISTYVPLTEEDIVLFKRFRNVFELAYRRFIDIEQAAAQARDAQIEAALERVRAKVMAMNSSKELPETSFVFGEQLRKLGIDWQFSYFWLIEEDKDDNTFWITWPDNQTSTTSYSLAEADQNFKDCIVAWKNQEKIHGTHVAAEYVKSWLDTFDRITTDAGGVAADIMKAGNFKDGVYYYDAMIRFGSFGILMNRATTDEEKNIQSRFATEFERAYTRFMDLQKAEAQAREAQIETSLERVRSRTMAMQKSEELKEVIKIVYQQLRHLKINLDHAGFVVDYTPGGDWHFWIADERDIPSKITHPYFDSVWANQFNEAKEKGADFFATHLNFEEKNKFYNELLSYVPGLPDVSKDFYLNCPGLAATTVLLDNVALYIENFSGIPYTEEENSMLMRFGKVFQQTYTRFLDLQKAEAQAREAQIEAALERVRSRSMAMHKSDELLEAGEILFLEMQKLGIASLTAGYVLIDEAEKNGLNYTPHPGTKKIMPVPVIIPHNETIHMQQVVENWKKGNLFFIVEMDEEETIQHQTFIAERSTNFPLTAAQLIAISPARLFLHNFFFKEGYVLIVGGTKLSAEQTDIMLRFAKVFQQTYTRFLDLQKAEAQAREAKIEAALERVRSRSLAMHHSSELSAVVDTLLREFTNLEFTLTFCIINLIDEQDRSNTVWAANPETGMQPESYYMKFEDYPFHHAMWDAWKEQKKNFIYTLEGKEKKIYDEYLYTKTEFRRFPKHVQEANKALKRYVAGFTFFKYSGLQTVSENQISEDELKILERFGRVFEQSYTRFIDLQKAEAQAREAQIEASLERVRSKTMAMHNSREVGETVATMFEELVKLGVDKSIRCGIGILNDTRHMEVWTASTNKSGETTLDIGLLDMTIHPLLAGVKEAWKNKKTGFIYELAGEDLKNYFIAINAAPDYPVYVDLETLPDKIIHTDFFFSEGTLFAFSSNLIPEETAQVLKRFAGVFGQTYRRYLDLQKAEAQAREAQIEAALEKIRSHTNAMRSSEDLSNVATIMFEQMRILGGDLFSFGIVLCDRHANMVEQWHSIPGAGMIPPFFVPVDLDHIHRYRYDQWKAGVELFSVVIPEDYIKEHFRIMLELPSVKSVIDMMTANKIPLTIPDWEIDYGASFKYGYLLVSSLKPFEEDKIFPRFAKVFEQTYTRFLDLQKAEAQAREAQIEAAMEKVRSRSLAMQKPEELTEVAELLRKEMGQLGVEELETSSIYIVDKENEQAECWYAIKDIREENKRLVSDEMTITFADTWVGSEMKKFYRAKKQQASIVMKGDNRKEWINYCAEKSNVLQGYYGDEIPERTYHLVKFSGGFMGAASPGDISAESWDLLRRAASAFSLAYTRFNDLQIAEAHALQAEQDLIAIKEAKQKAEEALTELQATQKQLIQSEKMASLGELTAGIAHEIQNPLNFVNNFSEVSKELLDEMREAIEKGDTEDAKEIMNDVIQNLEKINHHGKRADGIVKGMLQHSRSSSGQKEATDINALADEYLRLSYHGLRAKDKSFNATLKTDFDSNIGLINIIPQDMGRVILNLITNAFYVVNEKMKAEGGKLKASASSAGQPYEPTVEVSTKKVKDKVEIKVKDNGNGIPQKILDKIFQPFFTTKPTGQGTGLGLSLSYDIVKAHGGELKVETNEGKGSEFIIQLPINMNNG